MSRRAGTGAARRALAAPVAGALAALVLAGCQTMPAALPPNESVATLYERPAERALINGLRAYEDGGFDRAEQSFRTAILQGLRNRRDLGVAHKYLAFIACAFNRLTECEQQFRNAFLSDGDFILTDAEIGHPIWGPVYRKVATGFQR